MLETRAEKLMYASNLRLIDTINYAIKSIKEMIELEKNNIAFLTSEIKELEYGGKQGTPEPQTLIENQSNRETHRKTLAKLKRTLKEIENKSKVDL